MRAGHCTLPGPSPCNSAVLPASGDAVLAEPVQGTVPAVLRIPRVVARAVVGIESVAGIRIDHERGAAAASRQRGLHLFHGIERDAGVLGGVQAQHGHAQGRRDVDNMMPTDRLTMRSTTFESRVKENTAAAVMLTTPASPVASRMEMRTGSI